VINRIQIINGLKEGNITRTLNGEHVGTIIRKSREDYRNEWTGTTRPGCPVRRPGRFRSHTIPEHCCLLGHVRFQSCKR
jgi:hypothetical protein